MRERDLTKVMLRIQQQSGDEKSNIDQLKMNLEYLCDIEPMEGTKLRLNQDQLARVMSAFESKKISLDKNLILKTRGNMLFRLFKHMNNRKILLPKITFVDV